VLRVLQSRDLAMLLSKQEKRRFNDSWPAKQRQKLNADGNGM
jgi:hypothetical protein